MTKTQQTFVDRVNRIEERYKHDKYATMILMPRDLIIRLRDELVQPVLVEVEKEENSSVNR